MAHTEHKPKSWVLNYPALTCMLNGSYYADYASMLGTMGLPACITTLLQMLLCVVNYQTFT